MLSGRGICDELITRPEESYRLWCVVVCGIQTSRMSRPWPTGEPLRQIKNKHVKISYFNHVRSPGMTGTSGCNNTKEENENMMKCV